MYSSISQQLDTEKSVLLKPVNTTFLQYRRWVRLLACWTFISLFGNCIQLTEYVKLSHHNNLSHNNYLFGAIFTTFYCGNILGQVLTLLFIGSTWRSDSFDPPDEETKKNDWIPFELTLYEICALAGFIFNLIFGILIAYHVNN